MELTLAGKEADERARREGDTLSMEGKFFELMKRKLRKKRAIADAARQVRSYNNTRTSINKTSWNGHTSVTSNQREQEIPSAGQS